MLIILEAVPRSVRLALAIFVVVALAAAALSMERDEPVFSFAQVEAVFDGVGLDVEPPGERRSDLFYEYYGTILEPDDGRFHVWVFDDAAEAAWTETYGKSEEAELRALGYSANGLLLRLGNVLTVASPHGRQLDAATRTRIERAMSRLASARPAGRPRCHWLLRAPGPRCPLL